MAQKEDASAAAAAAKISAGSPVEHCLQCTIRGTTMQTHRTTCKVGACEPFCGLEVDVEDGKMVAVRPDRDHPITKGYSCIKGMRVLDYQNDPDRLLHPIRRW